MGRSRIISAARQGMPFQPNRVELGFIGAYDSLCVAAIIHLELLFRRRFEAQDDTPVRIARGKAGGTLLLYHNSWG